MSEKYLDKDKSEVTISWRDYEMLVNKLTANQQRVKELENAFNWLQDRKPDVLWMLGEDDLNPHCEICENGGVKILGIGNSLKIALKRAMSTKSEKESR